MNEHKSHAARFGVLVLSAFLVSCLALFIVAHNAPPAAPEYSAGTNLPEHLQKPDLLVEVFKKDAVLEKALARLAARQTDPLLKQTLVLFRKGVHLAQEMEFAEAIDSFVSITDVEDVLEPLDNDEKTLLAAVNLYWADIYLKTLPPRFALPLFRKACHLRAKYADAYRLHIRALRDSGRYLQAIVEAEKLIAFSDNHEDFVRCANMYANMFDYESALACLEKAKLYYKEGTTAANRRYISNLEDYYKNTRDIEDIALHQQRRKLAARFFEKGFLSERRYNDIYTALSDYRKAFGIDSEYYFAYYRAGLVFYRMWRKFENPQFMEQAREHLDLAKKRVPDALCKLAMMSLAERDYAGAQDDFEMILANTSKPTARPYFAYAHFGLGQTLHEKDDADATRADRERGLEHLRLAKQYGLDFRRVVEFLDAERRLLEKARERSAERKED